MTDIVPGAGTARICALVPGELVDQNAAISQIILGAATSTSSAASSRRGAIGLGSVLKRSGLREIAKNNVSIELVNYDNVNTLSSQVQAPLGYAHWNPG